MRKITLTILVLAAAGGFCRAQIVRISPPSPAIVAAHQAEMTANERAWEQVHQMLRWRAPQNSISPPSPQPIRIAELTEAISQTPEASDSGYLADLYKRRGTEWHNRLRKERWEARDVAYANGLIIHQRLWQLTELGEPMNFLEFAQRSKIWEDKLPETIVDIRLHLWKLSDLAGPMNLHGLAELVMRRQGLSYGSAAVAPHIAAAPLSGLPVIDVDIKDFGKSLALNPVQPDVYVSRGQAWFEKGLFELEAQTWRGKKDPTANQTLVSYFNEAVTDFDRAWRINERLPDLYLSRADARLERWKLEFEQEKADLDKNKKKLDDAKKSSADEGKDKTVPAKKDGKDKKKNGDAKKELDKQKKKELEDQQKLLARLNRDLALAEADLAWEKENWDRANRDLARAKKGYLVQAQKNFERADQDFAAARKEWKLARARVVEASDKLDDLKNQADKQKDDADKAKKKRSEAAGKLKSQAESFRAYTASELELVLADYNDYRRLQPEQSFIATKIRDAQKAWDDANRALALYAPADDDTEDD